MITVRDRVIGFFLRAPDEELSAADIASRWEVDITTAYGSLESLVNDGLLIWRSVPRGPGRGAKVVRLYRPGPVLLTLGNAVR